MTLKWEEEICCETNDTCRKHQICIWYFLGLNIELFFGPKWMDFFKTVLKNSICTEECTNHKHMIWWIFTKWTHPCNQPPRWISFNRQRGKDFGNSSPEKGVLLVYSMEFALMLLLVLIREFFSAISGDNCWHLLGLLKRAWRICRVFCLVTWFNVKNKYFDYFLSSLFLWCGVTCSRSHR